MVRLIDADALAKELMHEGLGYQYNRVMHAPTVDAVPVMHGEWLDRDGGYQFGTCSVCGDRWGSIGVMKYCPSCGAKMDAESKEDAPTIDAVPVIRCKDCKHYADECCDRYADETLGYVHSTQEYGYCWVAERKEE